MPNIIRDPVHGVIGLSELELEVMDTTLFQRLRSIRQLGLAHLTYPGAHHTRFEHSLGTMFLADRIGTTLRLDEDVIKRLRLAALLHDIGHYPFSHDCEEVVAKKLGGHEANGAKMVRSGEIADIISKNFNPREIASLMQGESFGQIISADVGADRMDYLLRDAHYTGVAYGLVDWQRIITTLLWEDGRLMLMQNGLEASESLLLARFSMFHTVYYHHSVRIARKMLQQAIAISLEDDSFDWDAARLEGDTLMLERMSKYRKASEWVERIKSRKLFKRALVAQWSSLGASARKKASSLTFAPEIERKCGASALVDLPADFASKPTLFIKTDTGKQPIGNASTLMASLSNAAKERATLLISSSGADAKKVGVAASSILEIN